ncbi:transmembrane protease serine 9-like [Periplaneta americana]|uniref:transmembrane protease serine 9-like n=1 Tax=Periplaneta americana TaxID=6978 RepID=UPI0037E7BC09
MKTFVALALLVTFGLMAEARLYPGLLKGIKPVGKVHVRDASSRITNGQTASRGQFPWQAALHVDNSWFCGGSLISNEWVLTAAHCIGSTYRITLGANNVNSPESGSVSVSSSSSIRHSGYNSDTLANDIGLVKIPSVSYSNYISPISLVPRSDQGNSFAGESVRVSGWGKNSDSASGITAQLQYVDLTVITNQECNSVYGIITSGMLCVSTPGGRSTCSGDSGGPLIHSQNGGYVQIGVVSFVASSGCESGLPAGFTRVTSYLDWIQSNTGIATKAEARLYPGLLKGIQAPKAPKAHIKDISSRITHGETASRGQFPYQVALSVDNSWFCGGSLISNDWVLTAGHCIGNSYQVLLGANSVNNPESGAVVVTSSTSIQHEDYANDHDIGLVKVSVSYSTYISPIALPSRSDQGNTFVGQTARASGWGLTSDGSSSIAELLQYADLTVITNDECNSVYGGIHSGILCVSTPGGKGTCSGDSGGPLVLGGIQIGIVSFGAAAGCEAGLPDGFARVTSYLDWIQSHTGIIIN